MGPATFCGRNNVINPNILPWNCLQTPNCRGSVPAKTASDLEFNSIIIRLISRKRILLLVVAGSSTWCVTGRERWAHIPRPRSTATPGPGTSQQSRPNSPCEPVRSSGPTMRVWQDRGRFESVCCYKSPVGVRSLSIVFKVQLANRAAGCHDNQLGCITGWILVFICLTQWLEIGWNRLERGWSEPVRGSQTSGWCDQI